MFEGQTQIWGSERIKGNFAHLLPHPQNVSVDESKIWKSLSVTFLALLQIAFCQIIMSVNLLFVREPCRGFLNDLFLPIYCTTLLASNVLGVEILRHDLWTVELSVFSVAGGKLLVHTAVCDFWCCGVVLFYSGWGFVAGFFRIRRIQRCYCTWKRVFCCCWVGSGRVTMSTAPCPMGSEVLSIFTHL